jgi:hypothetical protein
MSMSVDVNAFLSGAGVPGARFPTVGTTVAGRIRHAEVAQQRDFDTGRLLTWDDGSPRQQLVVDVATGDRDPARPDDDGVRRLYAKSNMLDAIRRAIRASGAQLENGGTLSVTYTGDGEPARRGLAAPKLYDATYQPPTAALLSDHAAAQRAGSDDDEPF